MTVYSDDNLVGIGVDNNFFTTFVWMVAVLCTFIDLMVQYTGTFLRLTRLCVRQKIKC